MIFPVPLVLNIMKVWNLQFPTSIKISGVTWSSGETANVKDPRKLNENSSHEETELVRKPYDPERKAANFSPQTPFETSSCMGSPSIGASTPPDSPKGTDLPTTFLVLSDGNSTIDSTEHQVTDGYSHLDSSVSGTSQGEQQAKIIFNPFDNELPPVQDDEEF